jgi:hypothetical protein
MKLKIENDTAIIEEGENDLIAKMIAGCTGKVTIKSPYVKGGRREITQLKDKNGKTIGKKEKKERI